MEDELRGIELGIVCCDGIRSFSCDDNSAGSCVLNGAFGEGVIGDGSSSDIPSRGRDWLVLADAVAGSVDEGRVCVESGFPERTVLLVSSFS